MQIRVLKYAWAKGARPTANVAKTAPRYEKFVTGCCFFYSVLLCCVYLQLLYVEVWVVLNRAKNANNSYASCLHILKKPATSPRCLFADVVTLFDQQLEILAVLAYVNVIVIISIVLIIA